jgi:hypothetical protein
MQEICHQSFISGIDSNPVAPHGTCNGSAVDSRNAIELLLCLLLILYKYHKKEKATGLKDCVAIRHPGQVRLRRMRAGIQRDFDYNIELSTGFRISPRKAALVRNDGFGEL